MAQDFYDVVVIGGGPGGYVAAIRASQLGLKVALVEREHLGGVCLNWGCIPTKTLLRSAEILHLAQNAKAFGIEIKGVKYDVKKVVERSRQVAARLSSGVAHVMKKNKIKVIEASASLGDTVKEGREVVLDTGAKIIGGSVILATGARAKTLPTIPTDGTHIVDYRGAMVPKTMPKSVIIVGSGAIGIEFASFYHDMGAEVTVLEALVRILPNEDDDISTMAEKSFTDRGITIRKSVGIEKAEVKSGMVHATIDGAVTVAERLILAVGITANTEGLGLENTAIQFHRGHIITHAGMATDEAGIYAIGDMTGAPWLAHKASHEGIIAAETIAAQQGTGEGSAHDSIPRNSVPGCTYCRPQIASVGLTEYQAKTQGHTIKIGRFPLLANGKAIALGDDEGLVKTIFDADTGALLGAHMIGPEVTELIHGFALAMTLETTEAELMHTVFPHPTLSEAMHESVLDAFDRVVHF